MTRFGLFGLMALLTLAHQACTTNPTTGRSQFLTMTREEEIQLGTQAKPEVEKEFGGTVTDPQLHGYIAGIGSRLAAVTEEDNPTLPWEFTLLDSKVINAFALPGGKVFISRGLAEKMTNEAQMAAVLGHEIGHVTARHGNERAGQQIWTTLAGAAAGAAVGAAVNKDDRGTGAAVGAGVGAAAGGIWALSYSRDQEMEADRIGMRYMEKLKYDPVGAMEVQQILQRESAKGGRPPEFLSTHPASETRIAKLKERYQKYYAHTAGNPEYQKFEQRYQQQFLARLNSLPPAKASLDAPHLPVPSSGTRGMLAAAALGDPTQWCAVCAAHAAEPTSESR